MRTDIDQIGSAISSLTELCKGMLSRIEAIEQRQAKLAVEQVQTGDDETKEWDTLANMLGMETVAWMVGFVGEINMYGFENDGKAERNLKAMLIGLAIEECNGHIEIDDDKTWSWSLYGGEWGCSDPSRPAAAIAMLNSYRGGE